MDKIMLIKQINNGKKLQRLNKIKWKKNIFLGNYKNDYISYYKEKF